MHPNPVFHSGTDSENLAFARQRGFGLLTINGENGPLAAHVPFLMSEDGKTADLHLMRSNPVSRALTTPLQALFAVSGPDGYISPDWYCDAAQVPTWNYIAVHLRGRLQLLPDADLPDLLARLSAFFETRLAPKTPWTMDKTPNDILTRRMRMIQPLRLHIESVDGTWKLGQNKPDDGRASAASHISGGIGQELGQLAAKMRANSPK